MSADLMLLALAALFVALAGAVWLTRLFEPRTPPDPADDTFHQCENTVDERVGT